MLNGQVTRFVGNFYEKKGNQVTRYYYAGSQRIAVRQGGTLSCLFGDHLGSTSMVTAPNGALPTEYRAASPQRSEGDTFTGQYAHVDDFGLMYYNARWYDPALGRFVQADTVVPGAGNPSAWDRYAYTQNNPLRYTDPSGHCGVDPYDDYYDYECHKLAQDFSKESGLPYNQVDKLEFETIGKIQKVFHDINAIRQILGEAPLNFSLEMGETTLYKSPYFDLLGGFRVYYQASGELTNQNHGIPIDPDQIDIGPWSVGHATLDYQLTESWIDNASTALNLGLPDLPIDPFSFNLSADFSRRSNNVTGTNTLGVEFKARTDRLATATFLIGVPLLAVEAPEQLFFLKFLAGFMKPGMAY